MGAAVFVSTAILQKAMEAAGCHTTYQDDDAYDETRDHDFVMIQDPKEQNISLPDVA